MFALCAAFLLAFGFGCENLVMQTGRYTPYGRNNGEFAFIYEDLIFLRVLAPDNQMGSLTYWEWAGKYKVDSDSHKLKLDMSDKDFAKRWNFSYELSACRGGLALQDFRQNKKRYLIYEKPSLRSLPENAPQAVGSTGVDPVYQPMVPTAK